MSRYTINLDHHRACNRKYAGGKGASLARLRKAGFNTPVGFVIPPPAFEAFLQEFNVGELADRKRWTESELGLIHMWFHQSVLPQNLHKAIAHAYRRLGGRVAVRSSMTLEDSETVSFAGQLKTLLNVDGEIAVMSAVKQCWASLFNRHLIRYMDLHPQLDLEMVSHHFAMAVVVQRMVPARAAGVAFSVHPLTGQPGVIVEAVQGLGDKLVSGRASPDRYVIAEDDTLVESTLANPPYRALPEKELLKLAHLVRQVHRAMENPQDAEWAWDGETFHLLQCRPITTLRDQRVYSTTMVSDMLPGLIKPLVWSVSTESKLQHVLGRLFTELIGPNDIDFTKLAKPIHSRIYADNTMLSELLTELGLPPNFFEVMSRDETAGHHRQLPLNLRTTRTVIRIGRFVWRYGRMTEAIEDYLDRHTREIEPYRTADWSTTDLQKLLIKTANLHDLYSESMWMNFIGPLNMMLRNLLMGHCIRLWAPEVAPHDLVRGLQGLKSLQSEHELRQLAAQAKELGEETIRLLATGDDQTIRATLAETPQGKAMLVALDDFFDRFGFLSAIGTDLSRPPWIEQPAPIWQSIARYAQTTRHTDHEDTIATRETVRQEARAGMNLWQRFIFSRVLTSTVTYINLRERTSFLISQDSFQLRRVFLAMADRLVQQGWLTGQDDIFYLMLEELQALVVGDLPPKIAQERIAARRRQMAADAELDLPDTIYGDHIPTAQMALQCDKECLTGISGSSGVVQGHAYIVLDPALAPSSLCATDILVVPFADVSWTPLFVGIGGIIAETGGQLSHSAIVARELGLPAVVNVKRATKLIRNGQHITLDGNLGRIYLV